MTLGSVLFALWLRLYHTFATMSSCSGLSQFNFIALFGAMALTTFRLASKLTNLLQGELSPLHQSSLLFVNG